MKKILVLGLVAVFLTAMFSCKKYEEGPAFSLNTKKGRLCQSWKISKVIQKVQVGDVDLTETYPSDWEITYAKEGIWNGFSNGVPSSGKWEFDKKKEKLSITTDGAPSETPEILEILKLKKDEFWFTKIVVNEEIEYHLMPK